MNQSTITSKDRSDFDGTRQIQQRNAAAARAVGDIVTSTLGPNGMEKMIVSDNGEVTITGDGSTVVEQLAFENPFARLIAAVSEDQQAAVSDGTTTAIAITTELLTSVETLLEQGIHPTNVVGGFRKGNKVAQEAIDELSHRLDPNDGQMLRQAVASHLTGVVFGNQRTDLADLIATAAEAVVKEAEAEHADRIAIDTRPGQWIDDFELLSGSIIEKTPMRPSMPTDLECADVLLVDEPLEVGEIEHDSNVTVDTPDEYNEYLDWEERAQRGQVDQILAAGADVVFCQKRVDDRIANLLSEEGVLVTQFTVKPDLEFLSKLLDIRIVGDLADLGATDLGQASIRRDDDAGLFYVEKTDATAKTLVLRGSTESVAKTLENNVEEAVDLAIQLVVEGRVVSGAGATEIEIARRVRDEATLNDSREQIAMEAFADALERVPEVLARNAGFDPIDTITDLRAAHANGETSAGIDVTHGGTLDALEAGIVDVPAIKSEAITSATEAANVVVSIDDILPARELA
ncbi:thermosome subunit beta [Natronorubrum halophilum]|uniref:thermosome subunit beta n=1 Tax=Natronorubrum halophilum TaxID=1702106 RepID=UPI0013CE98C9|nr:thermosome subunit beta [Natronorubrum halophilum]